MIFSLTEEGFSLVLDLKRVEFARLEGSTLTIYTHQRDVPFTFTYTEQAIAKRDFDLIKNGL